MARGTINRPDYRKGRGVRRAVAVRQPFLIVDGVLQHQDGVMSVRAERLEGLDRLAASIDAHDFY